MKALPVETLKAKILVVDDQPENLRLLADALGNQGHEVKGVVNGKMALMVANRVIPDLILLDVVMPGLNGYQVCQRLKADETTQNIPIIFLSASNNSVDRVKALSAGGVDFINKPFQIDEVLLRIRNQLQLQAAQKKILKFNTELEQRIQRRTAQLEIKDSNFLVTLDQTLADTRLSGHSLHLEITETSLMDYQPETINLFEQIRARGIRLNIDDFGTGYSSLQYLKRFPINMLKIDRSFIEGMLDKRENFEIVKMIIALSRTLKISIVAEGIENLKQLKVLQTLHCELGQGTLFSQPLDHELAELLIGQ